ncbi:unnamed protein product [Moneuplotes crassus]|uniref:Uncharacterized protein n=1 Tax=Euplotes crassus TaxID=5936 RepID=A0AAD1XIY5_EUPCR|nr:unnamed protein product [Moneuplotes crassus]
MSFEQKITKESKPKFRYGPSHKRNFHSSIGHYPDVRKNTKTINLKKDDSNLRLSLGAKRAFKPVKKLRYKKVNLSRNEEERPMLSGQKLSILIEMDNYKNSLAKMNPSSNKNLSENRNEFTSSPISGNIKSMLKNRHEKDVSEIHMRKHIKALKKLVKERDDELFDLKMALELAGTKNNTKKLTQKAEIIQKNLEKVRGGLNPKRSLVLSRCKKQTRNKKRSKLVLKKEPFINRGQMGVSKSTVASPHQLTQNNLKNSMVLNSKNSMKSITPVNKTNKVIKKNNEETINVNGLPPVFKTFENQSVSHKTNTNSAQNVAEKHEIKILNKKISQLEGQLSKYQKNNSSAVYKESTKEEDDAKLNYHKLLTNYISEAPDLSYMEVTKDPFVKLPTQISPRNQKKALHEDFSGEKNIVKVDEIAHIRAKVRLAVMCYEENLKNLIFGSNEISMQGFMNKAEEFMNLSQMEALLFSRYLFERRNKPKVIFDKSTVRRCSFILRRLKEFIGKYTRIETDNITTIKLDFSENKNKEDKDQFVKDLQALSKCEFVSPFDIYNLILTSNLKLDPTKIVVYLCRMSNSICKITGNMISILIRRCFLVEYANRKASIAPNESLCISKICSDGTPKGKKDEVIELDKNSKLKIGNKFFQELADYIKKSDISILDVIKDKIFDKVLNAKEYQLIKYKHLYQIWAKCGLNITGDTKQGIEHVLVPFLDNSVEIHSLISTMAKYGCFELFPKSNKHINYRKMDGATIRILNRIIAIMERDKQENVEDFLGEKNITYIEVVSPSKTEKIGVIDHLKLREVLREKCIIPYGEDLDEEFQTLLCLSSNREDLIMIRKMRKIIADIKNVRFFRNYGMYFREESLVDSDYEEQQEKPNMTIDKLLNESLIKKDLHENNNSSSDSFDANLLLSMDQSSRDDRAPEKAKFKSAIMKYADMQKAIQKKNGDENATHFLSIMSALNAGPNLKQANKSN